MEPPAPKTDADTELAKVHGKRLGRYELFYRLGKGGMANVYLGRLGGEAGFERWVAVKQIHEHLSEEESFHDMFLDEARVAVQLSHPNLVQVTDIGVEEGRPFLVMEYVKGENLSQLLKTCARLRKRLPVDIVARIIALACDGLHHAHELRDVDGELRGLVHRDLSPHNILISYDGVVKVTDFGIAKAAGRATQTRTGFVKGKPQYMSPEQALAKPLDRRSDIFSMGILLWEGTIGRRLFREESELETLQRITAGDVPRPMSLLPEYPRALEEIVMKALAVRTSRRYQTAREMHQDLEKFLIDSGRPVTGADLSEVMTKLFAERMRAHDELLAWARSNPVGTPPESPQIVIDEKTGSTGVSLEPEDVESLRLGMGSASQILAKGSFLRLGLVLGGVCIVGLALVITVLLWPDARSTPQPAIDPSQAQLIGQNTGPVTPETDPPPLSPPAPAAPDSAAAPPASSDGIDAGQPEPDLVFLPEDVDGPPRNPRRPPTNKSPHPAAAARGKGTISVMARPWCEVYLDGRSLGRTPLMRVEAGAGRHVLLLLPRGERPGHRRVVRVSPNKRTPVSVDLR